MNRMVMCAWSFVRVGVSSMSRAIVTRLLVFVIMAILVIALMMIMLVLLVMVMLVMFVVIVIMSLALRVGLFDPLFETVTRAPFMRFMFVQTSLLILHSR